MPADEGLAAGWRGPVRSISSPFLKPRWQVQPCDVENNVNCRRNSSIPHCRRSNSVHCLVGTRRRSASLGRRRCDLSAAAAESRAGRAAAIGVELDRLDIARALIDHRVQAIRAVRALVALGAEPLDPPQRDRRRQRGPAAGEPSTAVLESFRSPSAVLLAAHGTRTSGPPRIRYTCGRKTRTGLDSACYSAEPETRYPPTYRGFAESLSLPTDPGPCAPSRPTRRVPPA